MAAHLPLKLSVFLSAFLLFAIQPLITKHFLPFFGGSYTIWTISVFFFTSTLLFGYFYAGLAITWSARQLFWIHSTLLLLMLGLLGSRILTSGDTILTDPIVTVAPAISVLLSITYAVFIPTMLFASTSVIAQSVYQRQTGQTPYPLYALSNAGSLLGLASYPFVFELVWSLEMQSVAWSVATVLFVFCFVWALWPRTVSVPTVNVAKDTIATNRVPLRIVFLAAIPTFMLAALTEYLAKGIASFPLLWVVPLLLYLLSFIVIFRDRSWRISSSVLIGGFVLTFGTLLFLPYSNQKIELYWAFMALSLVTFFLVTCYFHALIFNRRPGHAGLGKFYLLLTLGGSLGSGTVGLLLPQLLNAQVELFPLFGGLAVYFLWQSRVVLSVYFKQRTVTIGVYSTVFCIGLLVAQDFFFYDSVIQKRNFYGTFSIVDTPLIVRGEQEMVRVLTSGSIVHGVEVLTGPYAGQADVSYYQSSSGIMEVFAAFKAQDRETRAAVIGLGAGALAGNCDEKTHIEYVDINPVIESLAHDHFSYLDRCGKTPIYIADGRLWLEEKVHKGAQYDLIVVDAFTDDAIPVHLLTKEAFLDVYQPLLATGGIVAVHISNRYLDLRSPVFGAAEAAGWEAVFLYNEDAGSTMMDTGSQWIIIGEENTVESFRDLASYQKYDGARIVWTDGKSSILNVLKLPKI